MLTPQEVSERAFPKASFGGYNMTQVDEFLDVLTEDYSALYSENAVLKSKMKVLVEKVEEYRSTEEAMRKALMTAQRMADDLVKEAEQKRDQILQEAAAEAQKKVDSIRQEGEVEQFRLAAAQKETAGYVAKVKALHAQAQAYLDQLDQLVPAAPDQQEEKMEEAVSDIDDSVQRLVAQVDPFRSCPQKSPGRAYRACQRLPLVFFPQMCYTEGPERGRIRHTAGGRCLTWERVSRSWPKTARPTTTTSLRKNMRPASNWPVPRSSPSARAM